jgi:hypothetical protein
MIARAGEQQEGHGNMPVTPADKRAQARLSMRRLRLERRMSALPSREQRLVGNVVTGMSVTKSLTEAGFNRSSSSLVRRLKDSKDLGGIVREACIVNGITPIAVVKAASDGLIADKPTGVLAAGEAGEAVMQMMPDHSIRLKASELGVKALQAAGEWPSDHAAAPASGRVRLLQIMPDGSQTVIEVSS